MFIRLRRLLHSLAGFGMVYITMYYYSKVYWGYSDVEGGMSWIDSFLIKLLAVCLMSLDRQRWMSFALVYLVVLLSST